MVSAAPRARGNVNADQPGPDNAPLIVTAELPKDLAAWATALRDAHFPPERNFLKAHVTLFHAIPPMCAAELNDVLAAIVRETAPVPGMIEGLMSLGGGTAIKLASQPMRDLRAEVAEHFHGMLTGQDQHAPRLHITIQNKVTSAVAKALQADLADLVQPGTFAFRGLSVHRYLGGPWELVKCHVFRG